jgi:oxygen-independent coproporphyrinogen-3 oxidase
MYLYLMSRLEKEGFLHYEISNFALPGYHSRHNSNYWKSEPYLGLGAGAHSYDGLRSRRANLPDIKAYIAATEDVPHKTEVLGDEELYNEFIMTRLRTSGGIPLNELPSEDHQYCLSMASPHIKRNLLYIKGEHLCLTREGIFTSNDIISDLMK